MGVRIVVDQAIPNVSIDRFAEQLRGNLHKYLKGARGVVIERENRGAGSGRLVEHIEIDPNDGKPADETIDEAVKLTLEIIHRDASAPLGRTAKRAGQVIPWQGVATIVDDKQKPLGAPLKVKIEDPDAFTSYELEGVALLKTARELVGGMADAVVKIYNASARRDRAVAKMVATTAKASSKTNRKAGKWAYRSEKERERTERNRDDQQARQRMSANRWDAWEAISAEYKDVAEIWSRYWTRNRKPGDPAPPPPEKPTAAEIENVFTDETIDGPRVPALDGALEIEIECPPKITGTGKAEHCNARKLVAEMIVETDAKRRMQLARRLGYVTAHWPQATKNSFKLRVLEKLGMERAEEVAAWLSLPVA
jgi:hypothetical protein